MSNDTGREGEILACFYLEKAGFRTTVVNFPGVDIVCITRTGVPFTVEVKSRSSSDDDKYSFRNKSKGVSDWIAYVALDSKTVIFESGANAVSHRRIDADDFTEERMLETLSVLNQAYAC